MKCRQERLKGRIWRMVCNLVRNSVAYDAIVRARSCPSDCFSDRTGAVVFDIVRIEPYCFGNFSNPR